MRFLCLAVLLLAGCTSYEFDLTAPPGAVGHVARKGDTVRRLDSIEYRFNSVDGRLVVRAYNLSDDALRLLGGQSTVVDPTGQSRRLEDQAIAPHSFIKLILPPVRLTVERTGPSFGIGVGGLYGDRRGFGGGGFGYDDGPAYFRVLDANNYWSWDGETSIRLSLVYQDPNKTFTHTFAIQRVKADR